MANPIPNTQPQPPQTVAMAFDDGTQGYVPQERVADAVRDGGKLVQAMSFDDGSKAWVPFDRVHDAIHDGGQLVPPGIPRPQTPTMETSTLGHLAPAAQVGSDVLQGAGAGALQTASTIGKTITDPILKHEVSPEAMQQSDANIKKLTATENPSQMVGAGIEGIGEFLVADEALKGLSLAQRLGIAKHVAELAEKSPRLARMIELGMNATRGGAVTVPQQMAHGASPTEAFETGATATGLGIGTGVAAEVLDATGSKVAKTARAIVRGKAAASPESEAALRQAATSAGEMMPRSPEARIRELVESPLGSDSPSLRTSLEKPIDLFESDAKAKYRMIDEAAGTDFKALTAKLENTNYQIRQLTETEEDIAKEAKLEKSRSALIEKIQQAKEDAAANGVDPKILDAADAQFMQKEALKEVQAKVFKNPNVIGGNAKFGTPERVNVDEAVKQLQRLADKSEYGGSRLTQAFGKDAANRILEDMYSAQRSGVRYLNQQVWAKRIAKALGVGTAGSLGYEAVKGLLSR